MRNTFIIKVFWNCIFNEIMVEFIVEFIIEIDFPKFEKYRRYGKHV